MGHEGMKKRKRDQVKSLEVGADELLAGEQEQPYRPRSVTRLAIHSADDQTNPLT